MAEAQLPYAILPHEIDEHLISSQTAMATTVPELFQHDEFFIDEKVQILKLLPNTYRIYDKNGVQIGGVQEKLSRAHKLLRFFINRKLLKFELDIVDKDGSVLSSLKRKRVFFLSTIRVSGADDQKIGYIKQKFSLLTPRFKLYSRSGDMVGSISGNWTAWNFTVKDAAGNTIGTIDKKWAGSLQEILTDADKYHVSVNKDIREDTTKMLILSCAITIDMILKEI